MNNDNEEKDAYCEVYGYTIENKVLGFLLCFSDGITACDVSRLEKISKPKVYEVINEFMKKGYVVKGRVIGKTQLYNLNKEHPHVKIFLRNFRECLRMVADEYSEKEKVHKSSGSMHAGAGVVSAKHI
jgi:sugar-specific transcriptional regulator TrmB